jgi:1,2-diacylglycerol 3-alpha-glucosyltransferase
VKILIGADTYYPHVNGASYFAQRLAQYLHRRGHRVLVIAPSRTFQHEAYDSKGVEVWGMRSIPVLVYKNFRFSPPFLLGKMIDKQMQSWTPDVVHVQGHFFICRAVLKAAWDRSIPTVGTNHFMPENLSHYFPLPEAAKELLQQWGWKQFRSVFEKVDIVTTPTKTAARLLQQIGLQKDALPISCGIDRIRFCPSVDGATLKGKFNIPEGKNILLYVGRLDKEKNIDLILRGFCRVAHTVGLHCVIAGRGAEENRLKTLVRGLGLNERVTFTGFVSDKDLPGLYAMADCFIIAGTAELQSIVTMEAMASGLPVIGVRAMALPELVQPGINGCLFDPGDETGVADCIRAVFSDSSLRKRMRAGSLAVIERHDIQETINQFETIYRRLATEKGHQARRLRASRSVDL